MTNPSIIKHHQVRLEAQAPALPKRPSSRAHEKSVELLRLQGRVHALQLTCSCGETTLVELDYAPETKETS